MKSVHCECGTALGVRCEWAGPKAETVLVEWMPEQHRDSHTKARNAGTYPHNGAYRLRVERTICASILTEDEWGHEVPE